MGVRPILIHTCVPSTPIAAAGIARVASALLVLAIAASPAWSGLEAAAAPARVVELREARTAGVVSATLSNGVLVHWRRIDSAQACLVVTLGGAESLEDASNRGVSAVLARVLGGDRGGGLAGGINDDALRIEVASGPDALRFRVLGSPEAVEDAAAILAGLLGRPTLSDEGIIAARDTVVREIEARQRSARGKIRGAMDGLLCGASGGGDPRLSPLTPEQVARVTPAMVRAWLERHAGTDAGASGSPVEAAVVGDLPLERAVSIARAALGGLGPRGNPGAGPETLEAMGGKAWPTRIPGPLVGRLEACAGAGEPGQTIVLLGYFGPDSSQIARTRALRAGARMLELSARRRLAAAGIPAPENRVGAGVTFSPRGGAGVGGGGESMLVLTADVPAGHAGEAARILRQTLAAGAAEAFDAAELSREAVQLGATVESYARDPGYWAGLLSRAAAMGLDIDEVVEGAAFYRTLTPEAVREALRQVVRDDGRIELIVEGGEAANQ